jgi:hypothetical protein
MVRKVERPIAVANHLTDRIWSGDKVNDFRRAELTSSPRLARGQVLADEIYKKILASPAASLQSRSEWMVAGLRDKMVEGKSRPGNRSSIDALIATHAVVYDSERQVLFVSQGPSLSGKFLGYDLAKSFLERKPVLVSMIGEDHEADPADHGRIKSDISLFESFVSQKKAVDCEHSEATLDGLRQRHEHYLKYMAIGTVEERCFGRERSRMSWRKALDLRPAYARERRVVLAHLR